MYFGSYVECWRILRQSKYRIKTVYDGSPMGPATYEIADGSVHVWSLPLQSKADAPARSCLDVEESRRADAFKFEQDQRRFILAHAGMRFILGRYCDLDPAKVPLRLDGNGKPLLPAAFQLGFNLSHSADTALLAVGRRVEVGVDVERIHVLRDVLALAERHFSTSEMAHLQAMNPGTARDRAFLQCWTRKEAIAKSSGVGLRLDLRDFHVGFDGLIRLDDTAIQPWDSGPDFVAALAVRGPLQDVTGFQFA